MRLPDGREIAVHNVVWDVDGTLFDTYPAIAHAFKRALNALGADAPLDRITDLARDSLGRCVATLAETCGLDRNRLEAGFVAQYDLALPGEQPPFPGARDACEHVVATGGRNVIVTHRGPIGTARLLAESGLDALISDCITRADGFARKPDPAAFHAIVERNGLRRDETLAVGDRDIDVAAGRAAGLFTCLVGAATKAIVPDLEVVDLRELASRLRETAGAAPPVEARSTRRP